jgi:hypothetical protein
VHDHPTEEFPGDHKVVLALGTWSDDEIAIRLSLNELDCRLRADVTEFRMSNSSKIGLEVLHHIFLFLFLLFCFNGRLVLLSKLKAILIEINLRMDCLDDAWETCRKAVMTHHLTSLSIVLMREIQGHFDFKQLLLLSWLFLSP